MADLKVVGEADKLPDDLLAQLSESYKKGGTSLTAFKEKLIPLIEAKEGMTMTIDDIIVAWYHAYEGEIIKRNGLQAKLKKLVESGALLSPERAVYTLPLPLPPKESWAED